MKTQIQMKRIILTFFLACIVAGSSHAEDRKLSPVQAEIELLALLSSIIDEHWTVFFAANDRTINLTCNIMVNGRYGGLKSESVDEFRQSSFSIKLVPFIDPENYTELAAKQKETANAALEKALNTIPFKFPPDVPYMRMHQFLAPTSTEEWATYLEFLTAEEQERMRPRFHWRSHGVWMEGRRLVIPANPESQEAKTMLKTVHDILRQFTPYSQDTISR